MAPNHIISSKITPDTPLSKIYPSLVRTFGQRRLFTGKNKRLRPNILQSCPFFAHTQQGGTQVGCNKVVVVRGRCVVLTCNIRKSIKLTLDYATTFLKIDLDKCF